MGSCINRLAEVPPENNRTPLRASFRPKPSSIESRADKYKDASLAAE